MVGRRIALLLATDEYEIVPHLRFCVPGAQALQAVLADPRIGFFNHVEVAANFGVDAFTTAVNGFLAACELGDVALLHMSGHMGQDEAGQLMIYASDSQPRLHQTAIGGDWLVEQLNACKSKRIVVLLDGCNSGSFGDSQAITDFDVANAAGLAGHGRVVIASASACGLAYERYDGKPESFTHIMANGLLTGDADIDEDGLVSAFEWFEFGYNEIIKHYDGSQRPILKMLGGTPASITVAFNPGRPVIGSTSHATTGLPIVLTSHLQSSEERTRAKAVWRLFELVDSDDQLTRNQALLALFELSQDPNPKIRQTVHWRLTAGGDWWDSSGSGSSLSSLTVGHPFDWQQAVEIFRASAKAEIHVSGDINVQSAGGDIKGSAAGRRNRIDYSEQTLETPSNLDELQRAIEALADEVNESDLPTRDKAASLSSLLWWAENISSVSEPANAAEQTSALRRVGGWVWKRFGDLIDAMPAAVLAAWAVEVLKHAA